MIVLAPDFMTKIGKKAAQDFFCAVSKVFDRVKTVALWSAKKKKIKKKRTIKGYGSAARGGLWFFSKKNILIPNVAEKNILILVEEKKII